MNELFNNWNVYTCKNENKIWRTWHNQRGNPIWNGWCCPESHTQSTLINMHVKTHLSMKIFEIYITSFMNRLENRIQSNPFVHNHVCSHQRRRNGGGGGLLSLNYQKNIKLHTRYQKYLLEEHPTTKRSIHCPSFVKDWKNKQMK